MTPLVLLRQVRYQGVRDVAVVQTGPADLLARVVERLPAVFPGCTPHVIARPDCPLDAASLAPAFLEVVRPEEREALVTRLRRKRFDIIVLQLTEEPLGELALLPLRLRARSLIAFNRNLDHFPLSVHRLSTIAQHFGATGRGGLLSAVALLLRASARVAIAAACAGYLVAVAAWLHVRGLARRRLRAA